MFGNDEKYREAFNKVMDDKSIEPMVRVMKAMGAMQSSMLEDAPLWMRVNYISNCLPEDRTQIDWDKINETLIKNANPYDFNIFDRIDSVESLISLRMDCLSASIMDLAWRKEVCRDCGEEFYLSIKEIEFFLKKELQLPKRCKDCRDKRKGIVKEDPKKNEHKKNLPRNSETTFGTTIGDILKAKEKKNNEQRA